MAKPFDPRLSFDPRVSAARQSFPVRTADVDSFLDVVKRTTQVETSKAGLKALGQEPEGEKVGFLSRVFGAEQGALTAPLRAVTAFAANVGQYPDEELLRYNPFEAAIRSARGDFAITGGDIIKVQEDDDFATRLGKYAGALAIDVGLDPISYVGPVGAFNKVRLAEMAVNQSDNILASTLRVASKQGLDEAKIVDDLFSKSRLAAAAKAEDAAGIIGNAAPDSALASLGATGGFATISAARKQQVAAQELGNLIGESVMVGGRGKLQKDLAEIVGSRQAARDLFRELPQEIAGGFFLKRPISGKPIARIAGGTGDVLPGSEFLSNLRFRLSASGGARWLGRYLDGQSGKLLSDVKRGIRRLPDGTAAKRDTIADFVNYKKLVAQRNIDFTNLSLKSHAILSSVPARKLSLPESDRELFDSSFFKYFDTPSLTPADDAPEAVVQGFKAAQEIGALIREAREEMVANGVSIGDLGPTYRNLVLTDAERERLLKEGVRGAGAAKTTEYNPVVERASFAFFHPDPEVRTLLGSEMKDLPGAGYLSPKAANDAVEAKLGRRPFEEDPIKVAAQYTQYAARTIAARRFTAAGIASGILLKFPSETEEVVNGRKAAALLSALATVNPEAKSKAAKMSEAIRQQIANIASDAQLQKVQEELQLARNQALKEYKAARSAVETARVDLVQANRRVSETADMAAATYARLASAADANIGADAINRIATTARNTRARLANAQRSLDELNRELDDAVELTGIAEEIGDAGDIAEAMAERTRVGDMAQAKASKVEKEFFSLEEAEFELDQAREFRRRFLSDATGEQIAMFNQYENALVAQRNAAANLAEARAVRDNAKLAHLSAEKNVAFKHAKGVDAHVEAYLSAMRQLRLALRDMPSAKLRTEAQKAVITSLRKEVTDSMAALKKVVGYSKRYTGTNAGIRYANQIVEMSKKLADDEIRAALLIADTERLDALISHYIADPTNRDLMMNLVGDMVSVYRSIRKELTAEDLAKLSKAQRAALNTDKAKLVKGKKVVSKAGEALTAGGGVRQVGASEIGQNAVLPGALADTFAPNGIADLLEEFYLRTGDMKDWQRFLKSVFDPTFAVWKSAVTVGRGPAYVLLNTAGGLQNNFLARVSAKSHAQAASIISAANDITRQLIKERPNESFVTMIPELQKRLADKFGKTKINGATLPELYMNFLERGGHFTTDMFFQYNELSRLGVNVQEPFRQAARVSTITESTEGATEAVQKMANLALNNPYMRMMSNLAQSSETFIRLSAFIEGWARYNNLDTAMSFSMMLHFDYADLSGMEKALRRFAPFYTFTRRNIPLQLRMVFMSPDQMGKLFKANENIEKAFGIDEDEQWLDEYLPDYISDSGGFLLRAKFGGNHIALQPRLPMNDLDRSLAVGDLFGIPFIMPDKEELVNLAGPTIKSPVEFLTNRNFQYGYEYADSGDMLEGQIRNLVPQVGFGKRVLSVAGFGDQERRLSNLYGILVGAPYSMNTFTEKQLRSGVYDRSIELNEQLRNAAAEAGVDPTWLRERIREDTPLPVLKLMIEAGMGDVETVERQRMSRSKYKSPADYLSTITALEKNRSPFAGF